MFNLKPQPTTKTNIKAVVYNVDSKHRIQFFRIQEDGKRNVACLPTINANKGFQRKDSTDVKTKFCLANNDGLVEGMCEIAQTKTSKLTLKFYEYYTVKLWNEVTNVEENKVQRKEIQLFDNEANEHYTLCGFWDKDQNKNPEADWEVVFDIVKSKPYLAEMVGA